MGQPNLEVWVWWVRGSEKLSTIVEREGASSGKCNDKGAEVAGG